MPSAERIEATPGRSICDDASSSSEYFSANEIVSPEPHRSFIEPIAPFLLNLEDYDTNTLKLSRNGVVEIKLHPWLLEYFTESELKSVHNILENWGGYKLLP